MTAVRLSHWVQALGKNSLIVANRATENARMKLHALSANFLCKQVMNTVCCSTLCICLSTKHGRKTFHSVIAALATISSLPSFRLASFRKKNNNNSIISKFQKKIVKNQVILFFLVSSTDSLIYFFAHRSPL